MLVSYVKAGEHTRILFIHSRSSHDSLLDIFQQIVLLDDRRAGKSIPASTKRADLLERSTCFVLLDRFGRLVDLEDAELGRILLILGA
jgi:hypothetical protein